VRTNRQSGGTGIGRHNQGEAEMVPADTQVNMTFTVTARELYLWTLELKRRGRTAVSVLRESMEQLGSRNQ